MRSAPNSHRRSVDVAELKDHAEALINAVRASGETIDITEDGKIIAEIRTVRNQIPQPKRRAWSEEEIAAWKREIDELAAEISAHWPAGVSAESAIRDIRREL